MNGEVGFPKEWFVDETKSFQCGVCRNVLNNPHCCENGHQFCLNCIYSEGSYKVIHCPYCDADLSKLKRPNGLKEEINNLKVHCHRVSDETIFKSQCGWTGKLSELSEHICETLNNNAIRNIVSSDQMTIEQPVMTAREIHWSHQFDEREGVRCSGCGEVVFDQYLEDHQIDECSMRLCLSEEMGADVDESQSVAEEITTQHDATLHFTTSSQPITSPPSQLKLNDGIYIGSLHENMRHGRGVMCYLSGEVYSGEWRTDLRHGQGLGTSHSEVYLGGWVDDLKHGQGVSEYANGDFFAGMWCRGVKQGRGSTRHASGVVIDGLWDGDRQTLTDRIVCVDGSSYVGEMRDMLRHGKGEMRFANGDLYTGSWVDNRREGLGRQKFAADGSVFDGLWSDDSPVNGTKSVINVVEGVEFGTKLAVSVNPFPLSLKGAGKKKLSKYHSLKKQSHFINGEL